MNPPQKKEINKKKHDLEIAIYNYEKGYNYSCDDWHTWIDNAPIGEILTKWRDKGSIKYTENVAKSIRKLLKGINNE